MLIEHLCSTCKNRRCCPIAERLEVFAEHATELIEEIAEPWWHNWEVRVIITVCERHEDRYSSPDWDLESRYEEQFEFYE